MPLNPNYEAALNNLGAITKDQENLFDVAALKGLDFVALQEILKELRQRAKPISTNIRNQAVKKTFDRLLRNGYNYLYNLPSDTEEADTPFNTQNNILKFFAEETEKDKKNRTPIVQSLPTTETELKTGIATLISEIFDATVKNFPKQEARDPIRKRSVSQVPKEEMEVEFGDGISDSSSESSDDDDTESHQSEEDPPEYKSLPSMPIARIFKLGAKGKRIESLLNPHTPLPPGSGANVDSEHIFNVVNDKVTRLKTKARDILSMEDEPDYAPEGKGEYETISSPKKKITNPIGEQTKRTNAENKVRIYSNEDRKRSEIHIQRHNTNPNIFRAAISVMQPDGRFEDKELWTTVTAPHSLKFDIPVKNIIMRLDDDANETTEQIAAVSYYDAINQATAPENLVGTGIDHRFAKVRLMKIVGGIKSDETEPAIIQSRIPEILRISLDLLVMGVIPTYDQVTKNILKQVVNGRISISGDENGEFQHLAAIIMKTRSLAKKNHKAPESILAATTYFLEKMREEADSLDEELLELLNKREHYTNEIAKHRGVTAAVPSSKPRGSSSV